MILALAGAINATDFGLAKPEHRPALTQPSSNDREVVDRGGNGFGDGDSIGLTAVKASAVKPGGLTLRIQKQNLEQTHSSFFY